MRDQDAIQMMQRCREEIKGLRCEVERLRPKAEAYDAITTILNLLPRPSIGYGEDLVWKLDKAIEEIKAEQKKAAAPEAVPMAAEG